VSRIREHMREYVNQLPDYTCRITLERFKRPRASVPFELSDRFRLEVAYTGGDELYSWPGDDRFEGGIEDLLPGRGMVSNGSYALHIRNLFVREIAEFAAPVEEQCEGAACVRVDFRIPAVRSGYALSSGSGSAPVPLVGSAWFAAASLNIQRLEVRVDDPPRSVRVTSTRETTNYVRARFGDVEFVVPGSNELTLRDRDGSESRNQVRFDHYRRFAGNATVFYAPDAGIPASSTPPAKEPKARAPKPGVVSLDAEIGEDAAIGDPFTATAPGGTKVTGRITNMRRAGKLWMVDVKVGGTARRGLTLPLKAGVKL